MTVEERLDMLEETLEKLNNTLEELNDTIKYVPIRNGGGSNIKVLRSDFEQRTYEKPDVEKVEKIIDKKIREYPKKVWQSKIAFVKDIGIIAGLIATIYKVFGL